jgi:hypothetical protein
LDTNASEFKKSGISLGLYIKVTKSSRSSVIISKGNGNKEKDKEEKKPILKVEKAPRI